VSLRGAVKPLAASEAWRDETIPFLLSLRESQQAKAET